MAYKGIAHCVRTVAGCLFLCYRRCSQYIGEEDFRERVFGMELKIRAVSEADAEELVEIYRYYVEHTAITYECHVPSVEEFRERIRHTLEKYPYLAAELDGKIVGYVYASPLNTRESYDWSVETSIYVAENARGQRIGSYLYQALENTLDAMHVINLNACIACPEEPDEYLTNNSVEYHAHLGYQMVGKFHQRAYKFGRWYHMVWMEKAIAEHPETPEPVIWFPELQEQYNRKCEEIWKRAAED